MRAEQLRELHKSQPFQPFTVHLADGRSFKVDHPEFLLIGRGGRRVVLETHENVLEHIDPMLITSASVDQRQSANGHDRGTPD